MREAGPARLAWDLGANDGRFSRALDAEYVLAVDGDERVVGELYTRAARRRARRRSCRSWSTWPTPRRHAAGADSSGGGSRSAAGPTSSSASRSSTTSRSAATSRSRSSSRWLRGLDARLVIEFADRDDPMVSRLLAAKRAEVHEGYGREAVRAGAAARPSRSSAASSSARAHARSTSPARDRDAARPCRGLAALHLLVLWSFAVAQPLFDLLGKNGEFFAARGSTRWDVVVFALRAAVRSAGDPARARGARRRDAARRSFTRSSSGRSSALFVLQAIRGVGRPGWLLVAVAAAVGAARPRSRTCGWLRRDSR